MRLHRTADHDRVQAQGRRLRSRTLVMLVVRGTAEDTRVGLSVSRKVGNAVQRNRVKRWLRESIRASAPPSAGPWDVVLIARPDAREAGFVGLRSEVGDLFSRVGGRPS